jgi:hypothetical protein
MINLAKNVIELHGREYPIHEFKVWWYVESKGLCTTLDRAIAVSENNLAIKSIPVAVSGDIYEVIE